jgi:hypothetical protein
MTEPLQSWPVTVTQNAILGSYGENPVSTLIAFEPDRGAPLTRQGTYIPLRRIRFQSRVTFTEKDLLDTFYNTTCIQGTSRVTRKNPKTGVSQTMKFDGPPEYADGGPYGWLVTLKFWVFS